MKRSMQDQPSATTYEVDSSHVPILSNASLVIDVTRSAANAIQVSRAA
jgi:hypothetical protein